MARKTKKAFEVHEFTAPSCWAPYLINGDESGLNPDDKEGADKFLAWVGMGSPVGCEDAGFMLHHSAYQFCRTGADCQVYAFLKRSES